MWLLLTLIAVVSIKLLTICSPLISASKYRLCTSPEALLIGNTAPGAKVESECWKESNTAYLICCLYPPPLHRHSSWAVLQNCSACKVAERNLQRNLLLEKKDKIRALWTITNKINQPSWEQNRQRCQGMQGRNVVLKKNKLEVLLKYIFKYHVLFLLHRLTYSANNHSSDRKIYEKKVRRDFMTWTQQYKVPLFQKNSKNFNAEIGYDQLITEFKELLKQVLP